MRRIAIIGLGRFGMALAENLGSSSSSVIAIDTDAGSVDAIKNHVDIAVRLDSTDKQALLSQDVNHVDVAVVAIGESFEAALLTVMLLKEFGVPEIICRAQTAFHAKIFNQLGVQNVIQPEQESGRRLARQLANPHLVDYISLSERYTLVEMKTPASFVGKTLRELELRRKYNVNLIALKRAPLESDTAEREVHVPSPDEVLHSEDLLVIVGPNEALALVPKE